MGARLENRAAKAVGMRGSDITRIEALVYSSPPPAGLFRFRNRLAALSSLGPSEGYRYRVYARYLRMLDR